MNLGSLCAFAAASLCGALFAQTTTLQLSAVADNTLYQDPTGSLSNGSGQYLFVGKTSTGAIRRGLIAFDIGAIPTGSRITDVQLRFVASRSNALAPEGVSLHRVLQAWGEGASVGTGGEGGGGPAMPGDATWTHAVLPTAPWLNAGGDFAATPSSTTTMPVLGSFTFHKTVELIADVQDWLDGRAGNHGWLVKTSEVASNTARRLDSRNNIEPTGILPLLTVSFLAPGATQSYGVGCSTSGGMPFTQTITGQCAQGQTTVLTLQSNIPYGLYLTLMSYDVRPEPAEVETGCFFWLRPIEYPTFGLRLHDITGVSSDVFQIPFSTALFGLPLGMQSVLVDWAHPRQWALSNAHLVCIG